MQSRLFDHDPITGITEIFHWDPVTEETTIETIQDVEGVLELNKARHRMFDERSNWKGDMHMIASIPLVLYGKLMQEGRLDSQADMKKFLNDPDNALFRTRPGRV